MKGPCARHYVKCLTWSPHFIVNTPVHWRETGGHTDELHSSRRSQRREPLCAFFNHFLPPRELNQCLVEGWTATPEREKASSGGLSQNGVPSSDKGFLFQTGQELLMSRRVGFGSNCPSKQAFIFHPNAYKATNLNTSSISLVKSWIGRLIWVPLKYFDL